MTCCFTCLFAHLITLDRFIPVERFYLGSRPQMFVDAAIIDAKSAVRRGLGSSGAPRLIVYLSSCQSVNPNASVSPMASGSSSTQSVSIALRNPLEGSDPGTCGSSPNDRASTRPTSTRASSVCSTIYSGLAVLAHQVAQLTHQREELADYSCFVS